MAEILLYGIIGQPSDGLDAKTVVQQIKASSGPLAVRINSPGGYVIEGLAIFAALAAYPGKVTTYIDGLAASMGSVLAMAGAEIIMAETALLMIHKPWDAAIGDAEELRAAADQLDRLEQQLLGIYAKQTGLEISRLAQMLAAETWFDAAQALEMGFATSIAQPLKIAALADVSACGFRNVPLTLKESPMSDTTTAAQAAATERDRISKIMALGTKHKLPSDMIQHFVEKGTDLAVAQTQILDHLATQSDAMNIGHTTWVHSMDALGSPSGHVTLDDPNTYGGAIVGALLAKISGKAAEGPASQFQGLAVVDIARDFLARAGVRDVTRMNASRVIEAVMTPNGRQRGWGMGGMGAGITHTTGDFPDLIGAASEKFLIARYQLMESPLKKLCSSSTRANFLTHYGVQVSNFGGALDKVSEAGEYNNRTIKTRKEGYKIDTYGNMFGVSRQLLINDGLGALADTLQIMAASATALEADLIAAIINSNPAMADTVAWFHATHGNLAASGGAPSIATLDAGRVAMRTQKDLDGVTIVDAKPKYLLVPVSLETTAQVLVASTISPTTTDEVNPFQGKLEPVADPRITGTAWYLFADPNFTPALQYSYLDGQAAPFLDSQDGWRVDGTEYKVRHDFGAGILDHRPVWKNPGA